MPNQIPEETKRRAVRLVLDHLDEYPNLVTACETVSKRLGFGAESLRRWVRQAQVDAGDRQGASTSESERVRRLERENRELREANAILRDAAVSSPGNSTPDAADRWLHRRAASQGRAVESVCQVLREQGVQVAARTYRAWKHPQPSNGSSRTRSSSTR
ncbi:transposase [Agrococcus beijingensis]|uniref:transposase n=1 Tax=Agrococcus beijingensis TaxID=3068634 RepID=UPI002740CC86|nr:transposase [Agrococcus sp. REN33]